MENEFCLEEFLKENTGRSELVIEENERGFEKICEFVKKQFDKEWEGADDVSKNKKLQREKDAIIGYEGATGFYKERIREILFENNLNKGWFPNWYPDLVEGVFSELYGLAGLAPWAYDMTKQYAQSSSAKLIGDRLFCLIDGVSVLQPQRISRKRRLQLKRALLLATPKERLEYGFHEVYLHNGIRITIFSGDRTKEDEDIMVFRKYVLKELSFENLAELGTIPFDAIELFKSMIKIGYNIIFAGQVRSGKTTFLQTWQKYEDPTLEGLAIATDPETPWHKLMPEAPIMQLIADGKELESITKSLLRGDNDYVLLEEMRDAVAYNIALDITSTGTMRSKATIHDKDAVNIPYKMASKIAERYGGDVNAIVAQVFKNFDYIFEFCQDQVRRDKKILKGISELSYDFTLDRIEIIRICKYNFKNGIWEWNSEISEGKKQKAILFKNEIIEMENVLRKLSNENSLKDALHISPAYYHSKAGEIYE